MNMSCDQIVVDSVNCISLGDYSYSNITGFVHFFSNEEDLIGVSDLFKWDNAVHRSKTSYNQNPWFFIRKTKEEAFSIFNLFKKKKIKYAIYYHFWLEKGMIGVYNEETNE